MSLDMVAWEAGIYKAGPLIGTISLAARFPRLRRDD